MRELARSCVLAADEVWRLQRGADPDAQAFQAMADGGHYRGAGGTRQGIYVLAAGGELLASVNSLDPERVAAAIAEGLAAWERLPAERRALGGGEVPRPRHRWEASRPEDGLVLTSVVRELAPGARPADEPTGSWNRDHVWYSREEARAFLPDEPEVGARHAAPAALVGRLARFHLVDNARGQTLPFAPAEVRRAELEAEVVAREGALVRLRLAGATLAVAEGPWLLGESDWTPDREWPRRLEAELLGRAAFDLARGAFVEFELVALARFEGRTRFNGRRGDEPEGALGIALGLAGDAPAARVAPAFVDVYDAAWIRRPDPAAGLESATSAPSGR